MAQEGSVSYRLQQAREALDNDMQEWKTLGLPGPLACYRMGDDEFLHHVHVRAITEILKDKLKITQDEVELYIVNAFRVASALVLDDLKKQRAAAELAAARAKIIRPGNIQI